MVREVFAKGSVGKIFSDYRNHVVIALRHDISPTGLADRKNANCLVRVFSQKNREASVFAFLDMGAVFNVQLRKGFYWFRETHCGHLRHKTLIVNLESADGLIPAH